MQTILYIIFLSGWLCGCTLSLQNVDTHGAATDLIDETQANTPNISPDINIPISPVPKLL